jgi:hypothetical protein
LPLWSFVGGNGSRIALDFGGRIPRQHPLTNQNLTEEQRLYEAERSLFVECPWSLTRAGEMLCSWEDDYAPVDAAFAKLIGLPVRNAAVDEDTGRLIITFANAEELSIVNDQVEKGLDGYTIFEPGQALVVDANGHVIREPRV